MQLKIVLWGRAAMFTKFGKRLHKFQKYTDVFLRNSQCNETNSFISAWVISQELNEFHLSLASD